MAVTRDTWRSDWPGQMCLHSAWPVIATLLSGPSSYVTHLWSALSASLLHRLWQDGILRNYGNVAQMSPGHSDWDPLTHTCHAHVSLTLYCRPLPWPGLVTWSASSLASHPVRSYTPARVCFLQIYGFLSRFTGPKNYKFSSLSKYRPVNIWISIVKHIVYLNIFCKKSILNREFHNSKGGTVIEILFRPTILHN